MAADPTFLAEIPLFQTLGNEERVLLASTTSTRSLAAGELLFRSGEPGDALYIVHSGSVELYDTDNTGQKIVLHVAGPGEYFGELSLLDGGARSASAVATEPTVVVGVDREDLLQLFEKRPDAALHMLASMGAITRRSGALLRKQGIRNVNEVIEVKSTVLERIADGIAAFSGSMPFLLGNAAWFFGWIMWNVVPWDLRFDPFPFGLLTMIVSLEAIFLSCFVLISQDRQAAKDRVRSDIEYDVNIRAELEVAHLHEKTDRIHEEMLDRFSRLEKLLKTAPR